MALSYAPGFLGRVRTVTLKFAWMSSVTTLWSKMAKSLGSYQSFPPAALKVLTPATSTCKGAFCSGQKLFLYTVRIALNFNNSLNLFLRALRFYAIIFQASLVLRRALKARSTFPLKIWHMLHYPPTVAHRFKVQKSPKIIFLKKNKKKNKKKEPKLSPGGKKSEPILF
jgi:hypothetical protein